MREPKDEQPPHPDRSWLEKNGERKKEAHGTAPRTLREAVKRREGGGGGGEWQAQQVVDRELRTREEREGEREAGEWRTAEETETTGIAEAPQ